MHIKNKIGCLFVLVAFMVGCDKKPAERIEYVINDVKFSLEAPLLEGSNEVQAEVQFSPEEVIKAAGFSREHIQDITVKNVTLNIDSHENFNLFESVSVQLIGRDKGMTTVASLSSVPKGLKQITPAVTAEVSTKELKQSQSFYWVNDVNLSEGVEDDISLVGDMVFLLDVKK